MLESNVVPSEGIEHLRSAHDVRHAVSGRVGQRLTRAGLGGQMHDDVGPHQFQRDVPRRIVADVERQERDPRVQIGRPARLAAANLDPVGNTSEEFAKIIADDFKTWAAVAKAANIQINQ